MSSYNGYPYTEIPTYATNLTVTDAIYYEKHCGIATPISGDSTTIVNKLVKPLFERV